MTVSLRGPCKITHLLKILILLYGANKPIRLFAVFTYLWPVNSTKFNGKCYFPTILKLTKENELPISSISACSIYNSDNGNVFGALNSIISIFLLAKIYKNWRFFHSKTKPFKFKIRCKIYSSNLNTASTFKRCGSRRV